MNTEYLDVFSLIKATITDNEVCLSDSPKWDRIIELLEKGKLLPVVYRVAAAVSGEKAVPKDYLLKWQAEAFKKGFKQLQGVYELKRVLAEAKSRNLQLIVFKGITLATLYPEPNMRYTSDADILVTKENRENVEKMLIELGYTRVEKYSKKHVPTYIIVNSQRRLVIELHDQLWEDYEGKQAEILASLKLDANDNLIHQVIDDIDVTTIGYNENLVYQIFHIVKHFFFEGIPLRYLVDITVYINKYQNVLDFNKIRSDLDKLHYEKFFDSIMKICHDYLGMDPNVALSGFYRGEISDKFIADLFGDVATGNVKQWDTINFLSTYFMRTNKTKVSNFQQRRKQIFPMPSELNIRYDYAKKCPLLLPFAWIHKAFYMLNYNRQCKRNGFETKASVTKAQYRLDLMRELEVTETSRED